MTAEENSASGDSHAAVVSLTEEQKQFIAECETEFANRYTEEDQEFIQYKDKVNVPPIVDPWYNKPRRNFDWSSHGGGGGGGSRRHQNWGSRNDGGSYQSGRSQRQGERFYGHRYRSY